MTWKTLVVSLLFLPTFAGAAYQFPNGRWFEEYFTPSGLSVWVEVLGVIKHANAGELTLKEHIEMYIKSMADIYGVSRVEMLETSNCESDWVKHPEEAITILGDNGNSYGLWQYHIDPKTGDDTFYNLKMKAGMPELQRKNWRDQTKLAAWTFANERKTRWTCYRNIFIKKTRPISTNW